MTFKLKVRKRMIKHSFFCFFKCSFKDWCGHQSCKNLGSVVALLQGNFEKFINLRQFLRKNHAVLSRFQIFSFSFLPLNLINQHMSKYIKFWHFKHFLTLKKKVLGDKNAYSNDSWTWPYGFLLLISNYGLVTRVK